MKAFCHIKRNRKKKKKKEQEEKKETEKEKKKRKEAAKNEKRSGILRIISVPSLRSSDNTTTMGSFQDCIWSSFRGS